MAWMTNAGVRCDLHLYGGQPHGFFNCRDGTDEYYYRTVIETDRFLASVGYLEGNPTLQNKACSGRGKAEPLTRGALRDHPSRASGSFKMPNDRRREPNGH